MSTALVTLVNPNFVHPPIAPYALDVLGTSLEAEGFDVEVLDLTFHRDDWKSVLAEYFAAHEPLLVGVTVRNTDTAYAQDQRVFIETHREVIDAIKASTLAPIIAGGVGFSSMPFALAEFFDIPFAVKGPGELILPQLASALKQGESAEHVPGLIVRTTTGEVHQASSRHTALPMAPTASDKVNTRSAYLRRSSTLFKVDNLAYYRSGGLGSVLTKNGCVFACTHCVEPDAKGQRLTSRSADAVVDEIESLTVQGIYDVHTTDSEFNLGIAHSKAVLREIIRRKEADRDSSLHQLRLWIYVQPKPFDAELAELLVAAGCGGINIGADHVREDMLDDWKVSGGGSRYYTFDDVRELCSIAHGFGLPTMLEVLLGMPGETEQTLREAVLRTLELDATVTGYSLGIRLFPYSPLGMRFAAECDGKRTVPGLQSDTAAEPIVLKPQAACSIVEYERQFMFDGEGRIRPVFYLSPQLPEADETIRTPNARWTNSIRMLHDLVPDEEHYRVMLPTLPGRTQDDNNYSDNPFLLRLVELGYTGAFWSHWQMRAEIMGKTSMVS
ncbi:Tryptophan 2-C-methyltransferase (plasmid) [Streptomyces sp. enrichment culture]|uniref:tryptophan 2-C-methyltransferase n=1 Tax=Streptomyces sp. enrichment culture TaxID=1795815 RepID=UPI003F5599F0